jgi:isoquinoline 1-oxidoreductase
MSAKQTQEEGRANPQITGIREEGKGEREKEARTPEHLQPRANPAFSRRNLFRLLGAGIAIFVLHSTDADANAQEAGGRRRGGGNGGTPLPISAWIHIAEDGAITAYTGKVEVGQNARTALTQAVAEELRVPVATIRFVMGDTDLTPYDMGTFGSQTTPQMAPRLHKAAAAAREQLIGLAAAQWQVDRGTLTVTDGNVVHAATQRKIGYGQLLKGQQLTQTVSPDTAVTPPDQWKVVGASVPKVDGRAFVTGGHRYVSDIKRDGMMYGRVLRPIAYGATLKSVDLHVAAALPGVMTVRYDDFVGVIAPTAYEAERALAAIKADWQTTPQPAGKDLYSLLRPQAGGKQDAAAGTPDGGARRLQATYTVAYIAHAPLEPRAAVAEWRDGRLTVWTGTQRPFGVRNELATAFQLPETQIRVIMPDTGSGYGGKHTGEAAVEAARLAKAAGKPVKLVWTREEEFTWAYFRPAGVIEITSAIDHDGIITEWEFANYNSGPSAIRSPYAVPNQSAQFHPAQSPLRQSSYRGLAGTANHFARESHMDDLARAAKLDPLAFRLKNLKDERLRDVLEAAAKRFGWEGRKPAPGRGYGIAGGTEKGSYIANCAEVQVDRATGRVKVTRVVAAFECGAIVNPTHLQNQIEGATVMGLGGALFEAIHFDQGRILNPHFADYRVPRFADIPQIEVVLINRKDIPSAGAGETPIMTIAPAIGNAICDAVGIRLCGMPMVPNGLKG